MLSLALSTAVINQVVTLYQDCSLSVEDIAAELELDIVTVKTVLTQHSKLFNQNLAADKETFTDVDYECAKEALKSCLYSEEDSTRFRAARFIINEKKGRNDIAKQIKNAGTFNVLIINQQMARAKEAIAKSKNQSKMIDVESSNEKAA